MRHQKQGWNDCILTTYAVLTDTPREKVHDIAYLCAREMDICWLGGWWSTISVVYRDHGPEKLQELCELIRWSLNMPEDYRPPHLGESIPNNYDRRTDTERPDLRGKGSLAVTFGWNSHIVAFEHFTIYDGNQAGPLGWRDFVNSYQPIQGWLIERLPERR